MGKMGHGYGSEFHLLRYLGYHRRALNHAIERLRGGRVLDWLDFSFDHHGKFPHLDAEWKGVEFLNPEMSVRSVWKKFWPQTGNVSNWDAVGLLQSESHVEFLLVEAKAHVSEIKSSVKAKEEGGLPKIREALADTIRKNYFAVETQRWLTPYYQFSNRLAHLQFLLEQNISARLIFIFFIGDKWPNNAFVANKSVIWPASEQQWKPELQKMYGHLGLTGASKLEQRVHQVFLPVRGDQQAAANHPHQADDSGE